jgi:SNF2 family DNA or RNA helicase
MDLMTDTGSLTVHASWLPSGSFFLWGTRVSGGVWDAMDLKNVLFAWHAPSFYGTFVETAEWEQKEGVLLPALEALDYFCGPAPVQHLEISWSREASALLRLAPHIRSALAAGKFMPDYGKWRAGETGWKLQLPDDVQGLYTPEVQQWLDRLIPAWVDEDGEHKESLRQLEQAYPLMQRGQLPAGNWLDEEDWLVAIGWQQDTSPFRTCLQLVEPDDEDGWRLRLVLQDRENKDVLRVVDWEGVPEPGELPLPEHWYPGLPRIERDIEKWTRIVPWLLEDAEDGLGSGLRTELTYEEAWTFLTEAAVRLVEAGCSVFLPAWWERIRKLRPRLKAKLKSSVGAARESMFGLQQLMQFDWKLAIGDLELTDEEFRRLLEEKRNLVQIRGNWVQLDPEMLAQIEQAIKRAGKKNGLSFREVLALHLAGAGNDANGTLPDDYDADAERQLQLEVELNEQLRHMIGQLTDSTSIPMSEPPASFQGTLRPYQAEGTSWLLFLRRFGLGGCLADDMGLGKTIQWITYLLHVKEKEQPETPSLLICPTSVLGNWQMELKRFAPSLKVHLHYGPQRLKGEEFRKAAAGSDLVLTSYTLSHLDEAELKSVEWNSICLDEAQNIKNAYTKQATAIRGLSGFHRIALTGTPIENRLTELWSIFDFINPGYLGTLREFTHRYVNAIEKTRDAELTRRVQKLIRPFLLRRVKKDPAIQLDLPEKNESKTFVSLTAEQGSLYENYIRDMFERIDRLSAMERRGLILAALTKLKQVCNHPALLLKEGPNAAWKGRSNKVERLLEMVQELRQEGDKCLIFTQFVETGHLLQSILERELGEKVLFLHGGTPKAQRDRMIAQFQDETIPVEESGAIFLLSLKAGGTGLNLTAANHVFHFDRWWNPAVENQATDRAFRIGQTRHVQVHKFVTLGTLEERIDELIEQKQNLSSQIVGSGENWITELSNEELHELFMLRREWVEW